MDMAGKLFTFTFSCINACVILASQLGSMGSVLAVQCLC